MVFYGSCFFLFPLSPNATVHEVKGPSVKSVSGAITESGDGGTAEPGSCQGDEPRGRAPQPEWGIETEGGLMTAPTSRASVGPFRAQEGMGSAAGMYRS
jgi:hypothetical protein